MVTSLEYDRKTNSLVVRKGSKFERINPAERTGRLSSFDASLVAWGNVACAQAIDDAPVAPAQATAAKDGTGPNGEALGKEAEKDPPPAKPIQQQRR